MDLPFTLPDWMPDWLFLLLALPVLLYALAFLLMPFSVFGVKARLEAMEAQIDSLQDDLRMMAMRSSGVLPPAAKQVETYEDLPNFGRLKRSQPGYAEAPDRAPVPTPVVAPRERLVPTPPPTPVRPVRREPKLD